jgi:hypothetical protein
METGESLQELINGLSNKKEAAQKLGISVDMVNKFLSVFKVSSEVQELIKSRKIDSIFSVHALKSLSEADQNILAKDIAEKRFSSQEARALIPLRNTFPDEPIKRLINTIKTTKDSKNYVNHFPYPGEEGVREIEMRIKKVVGDEAFSLTNDQNIGIFKITKSGNKKMREDAKSQRMGFHNYLLKVFKPNRKM